MDRHRLPFAAGSLLCSLLLSLGICPPGIAADAPAPAIQQLKPADFATAAHPRVFARADQRDALLEKIRTTAWAKDIYDDLKKTIDPLVARHAKDPQFIVSRLQMNWEEGKHYTRFFTEGNFTPRREGNAPYPTVRVTYGRAAPGSIPAPSDLSRLQPYGNGDLPLLKDGQWITVPFEKTALGSENMNMAIVDHAYRAAIVYYFTGDKAYAKFASDILWTFMRGASFQEQLNPDQPVNSHGYLSYETLGDTRRFATIPLTWDFIHDYFINDYLQSDEFKNGRPGELWAPPHPQGAPWAMERIAIFFQKFIDNKLNRGGGLQGNWNMNEHQSAMLYALAMDDNSAYANGKGREYYVTQMLYGPTTPTHGAYVDVARANLHPQTGLWPEPPAGYGQGSIAQLVQFGYWYKQNGLDVLDREPILKKGALSFPQMAFPNGYSTGWGDANYATLMQSVGEYMVAYARATNKPEMEDSFTSLLASAGDRKCDGSYYSSLFFYVPQLKTGVAAPALARVSYSPTHSLIFERNLAPSPADSLAYTVYGFGKDSGHRHRNGLAMELYGRGEVLAPDPGAGPDYWSPQHGNYNNQLGGHNTVIPNGLPAGHPMDLLINNAEPFPIAGEDPKLQISPLHQFTDTSIDFEGKAQQRRVMGIVRTSPSAGYYVDIFRSRMNDGKDTGHDYLYHNMGKGSATLTTIDGQPLALSQTPLDPKSGPGFNYFEMAGGSLATDEGFHATFDYGSNDIHMQLWMLPSTQRAIFSLTGPNNFRYYRRALHDSRVPTLLIRQTGEAWDRPFVAIYAPTGAGLSPFISKVERLAGAPTSDDLVAIAVSHTNSSRVDTILNATNPAKSHDIAGTQFQGIYAVISRDPSGISDIYLGTGVRVAADNIILRSADDKPIKARLHREGDVWRYSADSEVLLTLPQGKQQRLPASIDAAVAR